MAWNRNRMKNIEEIKRFFTVDLKSELTYHEQRRKQITDRYSFRWYRATLKILGVLSAIAIILSMIFPQAPLKWSTLAVPFSALVALVYPIVLWFIRASRFSAVNESYKEHILPRILRFIDSSLIYKPKTGLLRREIDNSLLFDRAYGTYRSENLIEGNFNGLPVRLANVSLLGRSGSSSQSSRVTLFSGIFCQVDIKRGFSSHTIIEPDIRHGLGFKVASKLFGENSDEMVNRIAQKFENLQGELYETGDPEFEQHFSVFTRDKKEAESLVNAAFRSKLSAFRAKSDQFVHVSFTDQHLNLAFDTPELFDADVDMSFTRFEHFNDYFVQLLTILALVETLVTEK